MPLKKKNTDLVAVRKRVVPPLKMTGQKQWTNADCNPEMQHTTISQLYALLKYSRKSYCYFEKKTQPEKNKIASLLEIFYIHSTIY